MKKPTTPQNVKGGRRTPNYMALTMGMVLMAAASALSAAGPVVEVGPNLAQSILNQINTYSARFQDVKEYGEQAMRWKQTIEKYQQQLIKMKGLVMSMGLSQGVKLEMVDERTYMVAERCGGFSAQSLTKVFNFNGSGDIYQQQKDICASIQQAKNIKYNLTVEFMTQGIPEMERVMNQMVIDRNTDNSEGTVAGSNSQSLTMFNNLTLNASNWESQMKTYDGYIESMEGVQKTLARSALKGKQGLFGSFVKTAALKGALEVGN